MDLNLYNPSQTYSDCIMFQIGLAAPISIHCLKIKRQFLLEFITSSSFISSVITQIIEKIKIGHESLKISNKALHLR